MNGARGPGWSREGSTDGSDGGLSMAEWGVVVVVSLANLVPIWAFRYFAGQDTPNHLYGGEILRVLHAGSAPRTIVDTFVATLGLKSNVAFHVVMLAMGRCGLSLDVAHRLILSLYSVGFPLAALFCVRKAAPRSEPLALLFLPLTWNWFALQGLYNYILSLLPGLVWLGLVARDGGHLRKWDAVMVALAALAVYFCHVGTFAALVVVTAWRVSAPIPGSAQSLRDRLAAAGPVAIALAPAIAVACVSVLVGVFEAPAPREPTLSAWEAYSLPEAAGAFLVEFAMRYKLVDLVVLGLPLLVLIIVPLKAARRAKYDAKVREAGRPVASAWPLGAAVVLVALYVVVPHIVLGSDLSPRLRPIVVFCLLCYGGVTISVRARRAVSALALVTGLLSSALLCLSFADLNRQLVDFTSGIPFVQRGTRLYPMVFDPRSPSLLVKPFLHAWGYYGVERDVVSPFAFAWHPQRFPFRYRSLPVHGLSSALPSDSEDEPYALVEGRLCASVRRSAPSRTCDEIRVDAEERLARLGQSYDYVLTWKAPEEFSRLLLARGYSVLHAQGAMILYRPSIGATPQHPDPSI